MAQPRPSGTIILDVDERLDSEALRLEVSRCYTYVGATLVRTHPAPADGGEPVNVARLLVKLGTREYLHASAEGADELWNDVLERWLYNLLHKIGNNMKIFNRRQRDIEGTELFFDWLELDLQNGALAVLVHCDTASGVDPAASAMVSEVRRALNEGALGEDVARVLLPAPASWDAQVEAGIVAAAEREVAEAEERAAAAEAERAAREAAEAAAEEAFLESPTLAAQVEGVEIVGAAGAGADTVLEAPATEAEAEDPFAVDEPLFAVDYHLWAVENTAGEVRTYDSQAGAFVD